MDALNLLQRKLRNLNQVALARLRPGDSLDMLNERSRLQSWVSGTTQLEEVSANTIDTALRAYIENQHLKGTRQIRLVCYGCTQAIGKDSLRLIEHPELFKQLLKIVASFSTRKRPLRKFYRGLLNSYFSYDVQAPGVNLAGRENREALRLFLAAHLENILVGAALPDWLMMLGQHSNLLQPYPCQPYEKMALSGDWSVFNEVKERLEINAESWLVREMIFAPVRAVVAMQDAEFKDNLDSILLMLRKYPLYAAAALQLMLDRYVACKEQEVSNTLRDYTIELWSNPWLPENAHQWQCSQAAKKLLTHWLKRHLLHEYFSLLCDDDSAHPRRLNFWDLYSEDLVGMYFALGKDAFALGNMRLFKFRHLAKGLIAKLTEGKPDVHACILQFEHYHVVEFNRNNGAAYFYDTRHGTPPFYLSKGWVEIGALNVSKVTQGVDVTRLSKTLQHQDTEQLSWEGRFAQELGANELALNAFCRQYECTLEQDTTQGEVLWLRPRHLDRYDQEVWSVLAGWGFAFSTEQQSYFLRIR